MARQDKQQMKDFSTCQWPLIAASQRGDEAQP